MRIYIVYQPVSHDEIGKGFLIKSPIKIISVFGEGFAQTMIKIQHAGYPVETKTIQLEFFQPIPDIGEQKMNDFRLPVVETIRIPCRMLALGPFMEKLPARPVVFTQSFHFIFYSMRVNQINDH